MSQLTTSAVERAIDGGVDYLAGFTTPAGSLRGDYDGPLFLTPGYVFARYATGTPIPAERRAALVDGIERVQNENGGFGLHYEGPSTLYGTTLNYVALRLLGAQSPRALDWIRAQGGAAAIPTWGKYWLAIMRLYDWEGVNPMPPELWLQPRASPLHPGRLWCHGRVIYVALSYLYGRRWQVPDDPLLAAIRKEILPVAPDWRQTRTSVRREELHVPPGRAVRALNALLARLERRAPAQLRERAIAQVLEQVVYEERTSDCIAIAPINKALDAIVLHAAGHPLAGPALDGMDQYLFDGERGLTMSAYESSELWDTAFAWHALAAAGRSDHPLAADARRFVLASQVREDPPERERHHRDPSRGGWPFSTREQGWPVSDCTAEGLSVAIESGGLERERIVEAVDLLLFWRGRDGGWPVYERKRASARLELLNASELFADTMVDKSYVELTSAAVTGLLAARPHLGGYRDAEIARALRGAERFLRRRQRPDGSWEGSWGICFTYGTWFGVRGLRALGAAPDDPAVRAAVRYLLAHQLPDGGWGESWESCTRRTYVQHPDGSQPVMTAWALLALVQAGEPADSPVVRRGVRWLLDHQLDDGDWPQRSVTGVFTRTTMLNYRFYRNVFPIWALGLARSAADPDSEAA